MTPEQKAERRNLIRQAANRMRSRRAKQAKREAEASTRIPYSDKAARAAAGLCRHCPQRI